MGAEGRVTIRIDAEDRASPVLNKFGDAAVNAAAKIKPQMQAVGEATETYMTRAERAQFRFTNAIEGSASAIVGQFSPQAARLFQIMDRVQDAGERGGKSMAMMGLAFGAAGVGVGLLAELLNVYIENAQRTVRITQAVAEGNSQFLREQVRLGIEQAALFKQAVPAVEESVLGAVTGFEDLSGAISQAKGNTEELSKATLEYRAALDQVLKVEMRLATVQFQAARAGERAGLLMDVAAFEVQKGPGGGMSPETLENIGKASRGLIKEQANRMREAAGMTVAQGLGAAVSEGEREKIARGFLEKIQEINDAEEKQLIKHNQAMEGIRDQERQRQLAWTEFRKNQGLEGLRNDLETARLSVEAAKRHQEEFNALMQATGATPIFGGSATRRMPSRPRSG